MMKRWATVAALWAVALGVCSPARALDPSADVRATPLLKTTTSWNGQALAYPSGPAEVTGLLIEIAPGAETGWHLHPVASLAMVLEGELEVRLESGEVKRVKAGDAFAEVVNTLHNGRNVGSTPVKLVVFYTGAVGQQLTVKKDTH
jgi:quercetin dioxygenase-like cupin family protein